MPLQTINLGDHINAAIDKMNENFELLDSNISALDSDFLLALISEAGLEGTVDSAAIFAIIAETGLEARIDSTDNGLSLLAQDFTNLETQLTGLNSDFTAVSTAQQSLSSRIDLTDSSISIISQDLTSLEAQYLALDSNLDSSISALATAQSTLESRIDVTDSNVSVLSQSLIDLEAEFQAGIGVDSAQLAQAVSTATQDISSRIDANSDEISIVSQSVTDLSADLTIFDSNLQAQITANADAVSTLVSRVNYNSDELDLLSGSFDSFQVTFQNALDSGIRVNSDDIAAAVGGVTGDLYTRIYANSDAIAVVAQDIVQLESKLTLLDSDGALSDVIATAVSDLRTDVEAADDSNFLAISSLQTTLTNKIDDDIQAALTTVSNTYVTEGELTSAIQTATQSLQQEIDGDVQTALTTVSNTYVTDGEMTQAIQTATTSLSQQIDSDIVSATQSLQTQINGIDVSVGYTLNLDVNGHVAGIQFNNDGATADMSIIADKFGIVNASNNAIKPFTVDGDNVLLSNATVTGQLNISSTGNGGSMTMTNDVMTIFDSAGNTRVVFGRLV